MARRRSDRWRPPEAVSLPVAARRGAVVDVDPPRPVWAWIRTLHGRDIRVRCAAIAATDDAVLIEWGSGQAKTAAWVWRAAVKHRADPAATHVS
jgi:hypothetical protein